MFQSRGFNLFMAFVCYQLLITAYYFQYVANMEPCPLCIFQRIAVLIVGVWFLIRGIHNPATTSLWNLTYSVLGLVSGIIGSIIAGRHIYLQNLPEDEVPACGPALEYLIDMLPINEVIAAVFAGDGECAKVSWEMLGISMPGWVMLFFIGIISLMSYNIYHYYKKNRKNAL